MHKLTEMKGKQKEEIANNKGSIIFAGLTEIARCVDYFDGRVLTIMITAIHKYTHKKAFII